MSNRELCYRWFEEVWNQKHAEAVDELVSPDCVAHGLGDQVMRGADGFKPFQAQFVGAFPDLHITLEQVVAEGDYCACRFIGTGTHTGDHLGFRPTGTSIRFTGMTVTRWHHGKIVEAWNNVDVSGILQQIGVLRIAEPSL